MQLIQTTLALVLFAAAAVKAAPAATADCLGFRITSPIKSGLNWTYGQCYSVDWDLGASKVNKIASVDLISTSGKKITTEVTNIKGSAGTTGNFVLLMGDGDLESGNYKFRVKASTSSGKTCTLDSVAFHVTVNPNSPPNNSC